MRMRRPGLIRMLVALAMVAVSATLVRLTEFENDYQAIRGTLDAPASINGGKVRLSDVRVGQVLSERQRETEHTPGMFVVVRLTAAAHGPEDLSLGQAQAVSGERIYDSYTSFAGTTVDTGFESTADLIFEVDPARIDDLTVELWQTELVSGYQQRLRVPLGMTADTADRWRSAASGTVVPLTENVTKAIP